MSNCSPFNFFCSKLHEFLHETFSSFKEYCRSKFFLRSAPHSNAELLQRGLPLPYPLTLHGTNQRKTLWAILFEQEILKNLQAAHSLSPLSPPPLFLRKKGLTLVVRGFR